MASNPVTRGATIVADAKQLVSKLSKRGVLPVIHPTTGAELYGKANLRGLELRLTKAEALVGSQRAAKTAKEGATRNEEQQRAVVLEILGGFRDTVSHVAASRDTDSDGNEVPLSPEELAIRETAKRIFIVGQRLVPNSTTQLISAAETVINQYRDPENKAAVKWVAASCNVKAKDIDRLEVERDALSARDTAQSDRMGERGAGSDDAKSAVASLSKAVTEARAAFRIHERAQARAAKKARPAPKRKRSKKAAASGAGAKAKRTSKKSSRARVPKAVASTVPKRHKRTRTKTKSTGGATDKGSADSTKK